MENFLLQRELTISCSRTERGKHMQLGIRLHDIKKAPLEERLAIAKEQGFLCGHLALSKVITEYPVDDGALTPGYAMYLKKIFAKNDLDIAVLGCYLNLANPDEGQLAKITHRYLAHIRFASLLGVGVVGTETGAVNEAYKFEEKNHSDEALDIFLARDLKKTHQHLDPDEEIEIEAWELSDLLKRIYAGELTDGKTVSAILAYACKAGQK